MKALRYFFCVVFPPLAVLLTGRIASFFLSVLLTLLGWIPGVIHARSGSKMIITKNNELRASLTLR